MRSMLLDVPGPIDDRPLRSSATAPTHPGAGEILIEVATCAVCRTDLQLCEGELYNALARCLASRRCEQLSDEANPLQRRRVPRDRRAGGSR